MEAKKTEKRQQVAAGLPKGFDLEELFPKTGLVPSELVQEVLSSILYRLRAIEMAAGREFGSDADFCRLAELIDACGERMPAEGARGLLSLARWLAGDQTSTTEVAS